MYCLKNRKAGAAHVTAPAMLPEGSSTAESLLRWRMTAIANYSRADHKTTQAHDKFHHLCSLKLHQVK